MNNCYNCKEKKEGKYFKWIGKVYCYSCLKDHFQDELMESAFENFLYEECQEV